MPPVSLCWTCNTVYYLLLVLKTERPASKLILNLNALIEVILPGFFVTLMNYNIVQCVSATSRRALPRPTRR